LNRNEAYATVLVEMEFLSNDDFVGTVLSPGYIWWYEDMGRVIADGLEYFADKDDPVGPRVIPGVCASGCGETGSCNHGSSRAECGRSCQ